MKRFFQPFASNIEENRVSIRITAVAFNTFSEPIQLQKILKKVREFICVVYEAESQSINDWLSCFSALRGRCPLIRSLRFTPFATPAAPDLPTSRFALRPGLRRAV